MSGPEQQKNPWTPKNEATEQSGQGQFEKLVEGKFLELKSGAHHPHEEYVMLTFASYFLKYPYPEFHESFEVRENGSIVVPANPEYTSILEWTQTDDQYIPEQVRAAAATFQKQYPQIEFHFSESPDRRHFAYTARLKEGS